MRQVFRYVQTSVVEHKRYKNIYNFKNGNEKETIKTLLVVSDAENTLPLMVVFPCIRPSTVIIDSVPSNWFLGRSDTDCMKTEFFFKYIVYGINKYLDQNDIKKKNNNY